MPTAEMYPDDEPKSMNHLSALERRALSLPAGEAIALTPEELDTLLADPAYRSSLGDPGHATHFRRGLPDGSGLHLVIVDGRAELHRDAFDPHAGPGAMALHLATDSPRQILSVVAAGLAAFRRLGS